MGCRNKNPYAKYVLFFGKKKRLAPENETKSTKSQILRRIQFDWHTKDLVEEELMRRILCHEQ